jgi:hypothetical protein
VLDRLEAADGRAELLALPHVADGEVEHPQGQPGQQRGRREHPAPPGGLDDRRVLGEQRPAARRPGQQAGGRPGPVDGRARRERQVRALVEPQPVAGPQHDQRCPAPVGQQVAVAKLGGHHGPAFEQAGQDRVGRPGAVNPGAVNPGAVSPGAVKQRGRDRDGLRRGAGQPAAADLFKQRYQAVLVEAEAAAPFRDKGAEHARGAQLPPGGGDQVLLAARPPGPDDRG